MSASVQTAFITGKKDRLIIKSQEKNLQRREPRDMKLFESIPRGCWMWVGLILSAACLLIGLVTVGTL